MNNEVQLYYNNFWYTLHTIRVEANILRIVSIGAYVFDTTVISLGEVYVLFTAS